MRWWPVAIIVIVAVGAVIWVRNGYGRQQQDQNIATAAVFLITMLLLFLWCLLFSRLRWKIRLGICGGAVAMLALVPLFFRIHGVTGDFVPIVEWRWKHEATASLKVQTQPAPIAESNELANVAGDYPQFLGPSRNATLTGPRLARDWKAQPPQQQWRHAVGPGWSGFATTGNRAVTQEQAGDQETVTCYDLLSGALLWKYAYTAHFQSDLAGEGPRATPTIADKRVYTFGSTGVLTCLELENGKLLWSKDLVRENNSPVSQWGMSSSPLVCDNSVIISVGGKPERSLVACRADTGAFLWGGGDASAGYSSPEETILAGVPQILIFNARGIFGHAPADGKVLWSYPWPNPQPHVAMPVILPGDQVLASAGYGMGSELFKVSRNASGQFAAERVWKSTRLKAKFTNVVYRDGFIYGLDDGIMVCVNAASGELLWKDGRYGHGQEILVGDVLLVTAESGEVVLVEPNPAALRELASFPALTGKTWNPPALAGQYLLVRNDQEAACYRLPVIKKE